MTVLTPIMLHNREVNLYGCQFRLSISCTFFLLAKNVSCLVEKKLENHRNFSISRPTDATYDRFLFSLYMCITLHVSSVKRSSSGVPCRTYSLQFLCLCLSAALTCRKLQDSAADRHKHRNWRLYLRLGTPDDESLTLETCRVVHI
jgi:hypothetical protein